MFRKKKKQEPEKEVKIENDMAVKLYQSTERELKTGGKITFDSSKEGGYKIFVNIPYNSMFLTIHQAKEMSESLLDLISKIQT